MRFFDGNCALYFVHFLISGGFEMLCGSLLGAPLLSITGKITLLWQLCEAYEMKMQNEAMYCARPSLGE